MRSRDVLLTGVLVAGAFAGSAAGAWPIASEAEDVAGLRCYPDHEDASLWWYLPARLELVETDEGPAFHFERYSYTGRSATGDAGTVWWKGVLSVRVRFHTPPSELAAARRLLEQRRRRRIALEPLPVEGVDAVLLYASAAPDGPSGDLHEGGFEGDGERWDERTFALGLSPETTQLLWDAFAGDGLAMSLAYSLDGRALSHRPARDPFGGEDEEVEPQLVTLRGDALPIRVSPESCPSCFASTELDARIANEYPFLEARCYDFVSGVAPEDLGLVIVEVRAQAVTGDPLFERVRFAPGGATLLPIHFQLAVSLDAGYDYRVVRVYEDGQTQAGAWTEVAAWSGILDVSEYRERSARRLDPRQLY